VGRNWGLNPEVSRWLYTAIIRPVTAYASAIWASALDKPTAVEKLAKLQRMACLGITGAMRTTPTTSMEMILGIPPLDFYLKGEAMKGTMRLKQSGKWINVKAHRKLARINHTTRGEIKSYQRYRKPTCHKTTNPRQ
jgi:hypothetical protein